MIQRLQKDLTGKEQVFFSPPLSHEEVVGALFYLSPLKSSDLDGKTNWFSCRMRTFSAFNVAILKKLKGSSLSVFFALYFSKWLLYYKCYIFFSKVKLFFHRYTTNLSIRMPTTTKKSGLSPAMQSHLTLIPKSVREVLPRRTY